MQEQIINFFKNIVIQDYILFGVSVLFFLGFLFAGAEKIYKAYLGIILGLFIFTTINLALSGLTDSSGTLSSLKEFFIKHKEGIGFYSIIFIPLLSLLIPLNNNISFRVSKKKFLSFFVTFFFGIFFLSFLLTIFLSIINNRFLFNMDNNIIVQVRESYIIKSMFNYFSTSIIFNFLSKYDYIINLIIILFIFYKMTIGEIVDYIMAKLLKLLISFFEEKSKGGIEKEEHGHGGGHEEKKDDHGHGGHEAHGQPAHH
ncbi:MAG: hypothetical protein PHE25_02300 [Candidatus Gracilibacteria bacterium]|nr:hypothetical protein [Candidatus Gracilibacteria bacterium]